MWKIIFLIISIKLQEIDPLLGKERQMQKLVSVE